MVKLLKELAVANATYEGERTPFADASEADKATVEATACTLSTEEGDAVLLFPDIFHRTQDLREDRDAVLIEIK